MEEFETLEILTEELSMKKLLTHLLPVIIPGVPFNCYEYRGKPDLRRKLPGRLRGYASAPGYYRVVILLDRDSEDCVALKGELDEVAKRAGLTVASVAAGRQGDVLTRIACEELEAWILGDSTAVATAFPRVSASYADRAAYRNPDAIKGGTAEALERLLMSSGYQSGGLEKVATADEVGPFMSADCNSSASFHHFVEGIRHLTDWKPL